MAIFITGLVSWSAFYVVLLKLSPPIDGGAKIGIFFFYLSLFFALTATFSLVIFAVRKFSKHNKKTLLNAIIREGALLSLRSVFALIMHSLRILYWWGGILLVMIVVLVEFYLSKSEQ